MHAWGAQQSGLGTRIPRVEACSSRTSRRTSRRFSPRPPSPQSTATATHKRGDSRRLPSHLQLHQPPPLIFHPLLQVSQASVGLAGAGGRRLRLALQQQWWDGRWSGGMASSSGEAAGGVHRLGAGVSKRGRWFTSAGDRRLRLALQATSDSSGSGPAGEQVRVAGGSTWTGTASCCTAPGCCHRGNKFDAQAVALRHKLMHGPRLLPSWQQVACEAVPPTCSAARRSHSAASCCMASY